VKKVPGVLGNRLYEIALSGTLSLDPELIPGSMFSYIIKYPRGARKG
jgi:hypothetical protein